MSEKQYLKMSDAFVHDSVEALEQHIYAGHMSKHACEYAAHAISSHDELVAENERLCELVRLARDCQSVQLSHLKSLLSSVSGDCYMGEEWEIEKIKSAINYTIDHKW